MCGLWEFLRAVFRQWILLLSGGVLIVSLGIYERFSHKQIPLTYYERLLGVFLLIGCYRAWLREHQSLRRARVSVDFGNGWYDLRGPDVSHVQVAVHFRLELTIANRDERNTTVTFTDLRVPGQGGLVLSQARFFPQERPVAHLVRAVDVAAGQTVPTILEVDVSFPNRELSVWGNTVKVEIRFRETFGGDLRPLEISVPHTP